MLKPNHTLYFLPASGSCAAQLPRKLAGAVVLLLLFLSFTGFAQDRQSVKGLVYAGNYGVKDILVVNFSAQAETRTDSLGRFTLKARVGDLLVLSYHTIETRKIRYTPDLVKNGIVQLEVTMTATEIEDVDITRSTVNSASLGIPMGKKYTPAERRLKTAGLDPSIGIGNMAGVSVSFDGILNAINGRTKRLKKELQIERREYALEKLDLLFTEDYFIQTLGISGDDLGSFKYYAVENDNLRTLLNDGRKELIELSLADIAIVYKTLNTIEK